MVSKRKRGGAGTTRGSTGAVVEPTKRAASGYRYRPDIDDLQAIADKKVRIRAGVACFAVAMMVCACSPHARHNRTTSQDPAGRKNAATAQVLDAVKAAQGLHALPDGVAASLSKDEHVTAQGSFDCLAVDNPAKADVYGECARGDPNGTQLMVVYGDSHAAMWAATLGGVAAKWGWKLRVFAKDGCPAPQLQFLSPQTPTADGECDVFHATAPEAVKALHPDLVIATSDSDWQLADNSEPTEQQWQDGWVATLDQLAEPGTRLVVIGGVPSWPNDSSRCLTVHMTDVQQCSAAASDVTPHHLGAEQAAASAVGALYIPTAQWICADRCEPVIANTRVFNDETNFTQSYAVYLTGALDEALMPWVNMP